MRSGRLSAILLIVFFRGTTSTKSDRCEYTGDLCKVDSQLCLDYMSEYHPTNCRLLSYMPVFPQDKKSNFTAWLRKANRYHTTYTVTFRPSDGTIRHVENCCNIRFGDSCLLDRNEEGVYTIHTAKKNGGYCYHRIFEERKYSKTSWCCQGPHCAIEYPCMDIQAGRVFLRPHQAVTESGAPALSKANHCFFKVPLHLASKLRISPMSDTAGRLDGVTLNSKKKKVNLGGEIISCRKKAVVNLMLSEIKQKPGHLTCFFTKGYGFKKWDDLPICVLAHGKEGLLTTIGISRRRDKSSHTVGDVFL